jgi:ubiquinone biosynthesis protein UbiJ
MTLPGAALAALEAALNRALAQDPGSTARLAPLEGRCLALHLRLLDIHLQLRASGGVLYVHHDGTEPPQATLSATPGALLRLAASSAQRPAPEDFSLHGDPELARHFQTLLRELDIDWEEQLARLSGDALAHPLMQLARRARGALRASGASLRQDAEAWLKEEARLTPPREEIEDFLRGVDEARAHAARLAARLARLQARLAA